MESCHFPPDRPQGLGTADRPAVARIAAPPRTPAAPRAARRSGSRSSTSPTASTWPTWTPKARRQARRSSPAPSSRSTPFKEHVNVLSGLTLRQGPAPTATAPATTPAPCRRSSPAGSRARPPAPTSSVGVSADQHVAQAIGDNDPVPVAGTRHRARPAAPATATRGYSCAYSSNLSWRGESTPNAKEVDPRPVFERLFGGTTRRNSPRPARSANSTTRASSTS